MTSVLLLLILCSPLILRWSIYGIRRIVMAIQIQKLCKKHGISFCAHRPLWFFGTFRHKKCECSITTPKNTYAIKLLGVKSKFHLISFTDQLTYAVDKRSTLFPRSALLFQNRQWKELPEYDFYIKEKIWKRPKRIFLFYPMPLLVHLEKAHSHERPKLYSGAQACQNAFLYSLPDFIQLLKSEL